MLDDWEQCRSSSSSGERRRGDGRWSWQRRRCCHKTKRRGKRPGKDSGLHREGEDEDEDEGERVEDFQSCIVVEGASIGSESG